MDSYTGRATWGGSSTLTAPSSGSAYAHLVSYAPRYYEETAFAHSPASSSSSMDSSPSPPSSNYPSSPVTPNWNTTTAGSPRIQSHGSPMMGSPVIREDFYREFDLTPASHSLSYSSILCPPPNVPHCLQQIVSDPSSHFSQSRRGPLVPQRSYSSHFGAKSPTRIDFHLAGSPEPGIPMRLLFGESAYDLPIIDPEGKVFSDDIPTTITLRIWWPGYEQWPRRVTMRKATGLLNRIEIAIQVAEAFRNFVEEAVPSRSDGHSDIYDAQWRVGRGGIEFKNLVLLSLYQASKGSFQADIRLEQ